MRLVSKNLLLIFSFCDQEECIQLQQLNKACYNDYIPRTLHIYIFERPYVHLYLPNRKRLMLCFLENMKAIEVPRPPAIEKPEDEESYGSEVEEEAVVAVREDTARTGFKIPDRLQFFTSVQFLNLVLVIGGMQTYLEDS